MITVKRYLIEKIFPKGTKLKRLRTTGYNVFFPNYTTMQVSRSLISKFHVHYT